MQLNWTCLFIRAGWIKAFIFIIVGAQCHRSLSCWCGERRARTVHQWLQHILLITVSVIVITQGCFLTPSFSWLGLGRLQGCTTTGLSRKICKGLGLWREAPSSPLYNIHISRGCVSDAAPGLSEDGDGKHIRFKKASVPLLPAWRHSFSEKLWWVRVCVRVFVFLFVRGPEKDTFVSWFPVSEPCQSLNNCDICRLKTYVV